MRMHSLLHHVLSILLFLAGAQGQKPAAPAAASAGSTPAATAPAQSTDEFLPLTPERKAATRELQYNIQKAEIRVQQLQVEIDEVTIRNLREINTLRQQQVAWNSDISVIATDFARIKQVDFNVWELDQVRLGLTKKKASAPSAQSPPIVTPETKPPAK